MNTLITSMRFLCDETRMLTGLSVSFGTDTESKSFHYGRAQETARMQDGTFVPAERPLTADSIFDLASLTKLFTAVMALKLVEQGKLALDETVGDNDPRFVHLKDVSVYDVLSFRANLQTQGRIDTAPSREEGLLRLFAAQRAPLPRIRIYSDINAMIIKYIVEQKTGLSFADALRTYILAPCGMNSTFAQVPERSLSRCVSYNYEHRIVKKTYTLRTDTLPGMPHDPKAMLLSQGGEDLCGHAGLFSTRGDMVRFAQALLRGELLSPHTLLEIGTNRTGCDYGDGTYRQYLGYLCFTKHPDQYLSEVPEWMGAHAFGLSGFTGNHISIDPEARRFVLFLGNRCHARVSNIQAADGETLSHFGLSERGVGHVLWPDGRSVPSSARYVHFKDEYLHAPIRQKMQHLGWL